jgi:hypothetical protein
MDIKYFASANNCCIDTVIYTCLSGNLQVKNTWTGKIILAQMPLLKNYFFLFSNLLPI